MMTDQRQPGLSFIPLSELFPSAPNVRKSSAMATNLIPGDLVRILVGPARGMTGVVVVDRNDNYHDSERYAQDEAVGVGVMRVGSLLLPLREFARIIAGDPTSNGTYTRNVLWFEGPHQLELIKPR